MSQHFAAILLAGGESRRMNHSDKGLLQYQQQALALHVLQHLQQQIDTILIVANRNLEHYRRFGVPVVSDWDSDADGRLYQGPLRGIYRAMRYYQKRSPTPQWLLLAPCDAPHYPIDLMSRYKKSLLDLAPDIQCLIPFDGERLQPLFSLLRMDTLDSIELALKQQQFSVMQWLQQIKYLSLPMPANYFHNINYPDQLTE